MSECRSESTTSTKKRLTTCWITSKKFCLTSSHRNDKRRPQKSSKSPCEVSPTAEINCSVMSKKYLKTTSILDLEFNDLSQLLHPWSGSLWQSYLSFHSFTRVTSVFCLTLLPLIGVRTEVKSIIACFSERAVSEAPEVSSLSLWLLVALVVRSAFRGVAWVPQL